MAGSREAVVGRRDRTTGEFVPVRGGGCTPNGALVDMIGKKVMVSDSDYVLNGSDPPAIGCDFAAGGAHSVAADASCSAGGARGGAIVSGLPVAGGANGVWGCVVAGFGSGCVRPENVFPSRGSFVPVADRPEVNARGAQVRSSHAARTRYVVVYDSRSREVQSPGARDHVGVASVRAPHVCIYAALVPIRPLLLGVDAANVCVKPAEVRMSAAARAPEAARLCDRAAEVCVHPARASASRITGSVIWAAVPLHGATCLFSPAASCIPGARSTTHCAIALPQRA